MKQLHSHRRANTLLESYARVNCFLAASWKANAKCRRNIIVNDCVLGTLVQLTIIGNGDDVIGSDLFSKYMLGDVRGHDDAFAHYCWSY